MNDHSSVIVDKRAAVLDAALDLFDERTFHGSPMPELADRAGVAAGTIYRYFPSKEALGNELFRSWKLALAERIGDTSTAPSARAGFDQYWNGVIGFALDHPRAFSFLELHRHDPYLDDDSCALATSIDAEAARFVRRFQRRGEIRPGSPELLVAMVFGAIVGLVKASTTHGFALDTRRLSVARAAAWALLAPVPSQEDSP
jgi:TetR/AcrR family transcriptional regulator, repressor of fatR-cypB operon